MVKKLHNVVITKLFMKFIQGLQMTGAALPTGKEPA